MLLSYCELTTRIQEGGPKEEAGPRQSDVPSSCSVPFSPKICVNRRNLRTTGFGCRRRPRWEAIDKPLPLLLLEATSQDSAPAPLAPLYEKTREVLAAGMVLEQSAKRRRRKKG